MGHQLLCTNYQTLAVRTENYTQYQQCISATAVPTKENDNLFRVPSNKVTPVQFYTSN